MAELENAPKRELSPKQRTAIISSVELGRQLQLEHPEIAEDYRSGKCISEIVRDYKIVYSYSVTNRIAFTAVQHALRGHDGGFNNVPYSGLIMDTSELERLASEHIITGGYKTYEQVKGIHALTHNKRVEAGKLGGLIGGRIVREQGIGIFARCSPCSV